MLFPPPSSGYVIFTVSQRAPQAPRTATVRSDDMMNSGYPGGPALGRIRCYEDDVWSRNAELAITSGLSFKMMN